MIHQTYIARKRPKTSPGNHEIDQSAADAARCLQPAHTIHTHPGVSAALTRFLARWLWLSTFNLDIRIRARFLYNEPNRLVSSSNV